MDRALGHLRGHVALDEFLGVVHGEDSRIAPALTVAEEADCDDSAGWETFDVE